MSQATAGRLGDFRLLEKLGEGGERVVFKALALCPVADIREGETVAVSCLRACDPEAFRREARILSALVHPGIVRYRHAFAAEDEGDPFGALECLVTEFLEGRTLQAILATTNEGRGLSWSQARPWAVQMLRALEFAAGHGVVHRDLKPANVFVTREGVVKLIDFGTAHLRQEGDETLGDVSPCGSWDYLAPEFARPPGRGFRGDERSDIFSFGVCLHQMVTGQLPFDSLAGEGAAFAFQRRWGPAW